MYLLLRIRLILYFHVSFLGDFFFPTESPQVMEVEEIYKPDKVKEAQASWELQGACVAVKCSSPLRPSNDEILQLVFFGG